LESKEAAVQTTIKNILTTCELAFSVEHDAANKLVLCTSCATEISSNYGVLRGSQFLTNYQ